MFGENMVCIEKGREKGTSDLKAEGSLSIYFTSDL